MSEHLDKMIERLDARKRGEAGYVTHLPEVQAILSELSPLVPALVAFEHEERGEVSVKITIGFTIEREG